MPTVDEFLDAKPSVDSFLDAGKRNAVDDFLDGKQDNGKGRLHSAGSSAALGATEGMGQSLQGVARAGHIAGPAMAFMQPPGVVLPPAVTLDIARQQQAWENTPAAEREKLLQSDPLYQAGEYIVGGAREAYEPNPKFKGEFWTDTIPHSAGGMLPTVAAGMVAGPAAGALQYGTAQGQQEAEAAIAAGDIEDADKVFLLNLGIGGVSEFALGVPANILKYAKAARRANVPAEVAKETILRMAGRGAAHEAGQEGLEQLGQNVIARNTYDPQRPYLKDVPASMAAGAVLGGGMSGGGAAIGRLVSRDETARTVPNTRDELPAPPMMEQDQNAQTFRRAEAEFNAGAGLNEAVDETGARSPVDDFLDATTTERNAQRNPFLAPVDETAMEYAGGEMPSQSSEFRVPSSEFSRTEPVTATEPAGTPTAATTPESSLPQTPSTKGGETKTGGENVVPDSDELERIAYRTSVALEKAEQTGQPESVLRPLREANNKAERAAIAAEEARESLSVKETGTVAGQTRVGEQSAPLPPVSKGKVEIKVKNPYGLAPENEKIQTVTGKPITLTGAPGHEFVVYSTGKYWRVVERSSGLSFGNQAEKTQAAAIASAEKALAAVKPGLFDQVVSEAEKLNPKSGQPTSSQNPARQEVSNLTESNPVIHTIKNPDGTVTSKRRANYYQTKGNKWPAFFYEVKEQWGKKYFSADGGLTWSGTLEKARTAAIENNSLVEVASSQKVSKPVETPAAAVDKVQELRAREERILSDIDDWRAGRFASPGQPMTGQNYQLVMRDNVAKLDAELAKVRLELAKEGSAVANGGKQNENENTTQKAVGDISARNEAPPERQLDDGDNLIAVGPQVARADVDNGTRQTQYRVRRVTDAERNARWETYGNTPWVVERRTVRTKDGKRESGEHDEWMPFARGESRKSAMQDASADTGFYQAESLDKTHAAVAGEQKALIAWQKSKQDRLKSAMQELRFASEEVQRIRDEGNKKYKTALKRAKLFDDAGKGTADPAKIKAIQDKLLPEWKAKMEAAVAKRDSLQARVNSIESEKFVSKPAETPAAAVAKVQEHVSEVASGDKSVSLPESVELNELRIVKEQRGKLGRLNAERLAELEAKGNLATGPRPAKEIKSELVERLEEIAKTVPKPDIKEFGLKKSQGVRSVSFVLNDTTVTAVESGKAGSWEIVTDAGTSNRKVIATTGRYADINEARRVAAATLEEMVYPERAQPVTVEIPGDGTFTIKKTHYAINRTLERARKLDTSSEKPASFERSGISKEDAQWVKDNKQTVAADKFEQALDKAIAATDLDQRKMLEGVTGMPVWLTKAALNGFLRVLRVAYQQSKNVAHALAAAKDWLARQNLPGYNAQQAESWTAGVDWHGTVLGGDATLKPRKIGERIDEGVASGTFSEGMADMVENRWYQVRHQDDVLAAASRAIQLIGGADQAALRWNELSRGVPSDDKVALGAVLVRDLARQEAAATAAGDAQRARDLQIAASNFVDQQFAQLGTDVGRGVAMFKVFLNMSPKAKFLWARNQVQQASDAVVRQVSPDVNEAAVEIDKINADGIEATTRTPEVQGAAGKAVDAAVQQQAQTPGTELHDALKLEASNSLQMLPSVINAAREKVVRALQKLGVNEYAETLTRRGANSLLAAIESAVAPGKQRAATVAAMMGDLTSSLRDQINDALGVKPGQVVNPQTYMMRLRSLFNNAEMLSRVWGKVRDGLQEKLAVIPELEKKIFALSEEMARVSAKNNEPITIPEQTTPAITESVRAEAMRVRAANVAAELRELHRQHEQAVHDLAEMKKLEPAWKKIANLSPVEVFGSGIVRGVINEHLKSQSQNIVRLVTNHFRGIGIDPAQMATPVAERLATEAGLEPAMAKSLVAAIEKEWKAMVAKEQAALTKRLAAARQRKAEAEAARMERTKKSRSVADREAESAAKKLAADSRPEARKPAVQEFYQRLTSNLRRLLPTTANGRTLSDMELVREAFLNPEQYQDVWQRLGTELRAKYGIEGMAGIETTLGALTPQALVESNIDRIIGQQLQSARQSLGAIVRQHFTKHEATGRTLAEKIAAEAGLSGDAAQALADAVQRRFAALVTAKKQALLDNLLKPVRDKGLAKPGMAQRLIEATNAGQLSAEQFWNAVKERLKLPAWSPELSRQIEDAVNEIERIPESQVDKRMAAMERMMTLVKRAEGYTLIDLGGSFFVTNLMLSLGSRKANMLGNTLQTLGTAASEGLQLLMEGRIADGLTALESVRRGGRQTAGNIAGALTTGHLPAVRMEKVEAMRALENMRFGEAGGVPLRGDTRAQQIAKRVLEQKIFKVLNAWKYNGRELAAEDLLFFTPAYQAKLTLLVTRLMRQQGLSGPEARTKAAEMLGFGAERTEQAENQAIKEGYTGAAKWRRTAEILQSNIPEHLKESARDFALRMTLNNTPYGALGVVVKAVERLKSSERDSIRAAATAIFPIVNVPANWFNESLNYSPMGFVRVLRGELYGQKKTELHQENRAEHWRDLRAEVLSKATLGTLLLAAAAFKLWPDDDDNDKPKLFGSGPMMPQDREGWKAAGHIPYSVVVGGKAYSYANSPLAVPLSIIATMMDRERDATLYKVPSAERSLGSVSALAGLSVAQAAGTMLDQSFMVGMADMIESLSEKNPEVQAKRLASVFGRTATSVVIPQELRAIDKRLDPTVYRPQDVAASLWQSVPFARRMGAPGINALGQPVVWPPDKRFTSEVKPDKVTALFNDSGAWPSLPNRNEVIAGLGRAPTDEEWYRYVELSGAKVQRIVNRYADNPAELEATFKRMHPRGPSPSLMAELKGKTAAERNEIIRRAALAEIVSESRRRTRIEMGWQKP